MTTYDNNDDNVDNNNDSENEDENDNDVVCTTHRYLDWGWCIFICMFVRTLVAKVKS